MTNVVEHPGTPPDILEQIDDTVDERCACGCHRAVPPGGASAWFATQDCQQRWHSRQATNPDAVYSREDYHGQPHESENVNSSGSSGSSGPAAEEQLPEPWLCPDPHGAGYRRHCPGCDQRAVPSYRIDSAGPWLSCGACNAVLPDQGYLATVYEEPEHLLLELSAGDTRVRRHLPLQQLRRARNPDDYIWSTWVSMERELRQFARRWHGHRPSGGAPR